MPSSASTPTHVRRHPIAIRVRGLRILSDLIVKSSSTPIGTALTRSTLTSVVAHLTRDPVFVARDVRVSVAVIRKQVQNAPTGGPDKFDDFILGDSVHFDLHRRQRHDQPVFQTPPGGD